MKTTVLVFLLAPAALAAQGATAQTHTSVSASAQAHVTAEHVVPATFSAQGKAKLEAMYTTAHDNNLPEQPIAHRVAEGQAKGASEAAILASAGRVEANLQATHDAMVAAGRPQPSQNEVARGGNAMERGVTRVQIETMVQHTPSGRSLVVAFDVLTELAARGVPVTQALAQIQSKLDARASDMAIASLVTNVGVNVGAANHANGSGTGSAGGTATGNGMGSGTGGAGTTASGNAAGGAGGAVKGATGSVTGTVTGTIGGVIRKP